VRAQNKGSHFSSSKVELGFFGSSFISREILFYLWMTIGKQLTNNNVEYIFSSWLIS